MTSAISQPEIARDSNTEKDRWLRAYQQMVRIRLFEEQVNELYTRALMPGLAHLYSGEEAVAVGICEALRIDDYITSTHRGHGHCLAKGASPDRMFAELLGKEAGYCRGKGGSMHIADPATGNLGANAIVGGSVGIATGAAFASKRLGNGRVAICFFGEGAVAEGEFHESLNLAALWGLPVLFICENNQYMEYTPIGSVTAVPRPAADRAAAGREGLVDAHLAHVDRLGLLPAEQPRVETGSRRRVGLVGVDPARHPGRIILTVLMTAGYSRCHRAFPRPGPVGRGDGDRLVVAAACGGRAGDGRGAVAVVGEGHPGGSAAGYLIGRPVVGWGARRRVRRRDGADISRWYGLSACIADGEVLRVHFLVTGLSARLRGQR